MFISFILLYFVLTNKKTKVFHNKSNKKMNTSTSRNKARVKRSEKLQTAELNAYKKKVYSFDTKIDAAAFFGFSVVTLDAVLLKGSGKPSTIKTIREKLTPAA